MTSSADAPRRVLAAAIALAWLAPAAATAQETRPAREADAHGLRAVDVTNPGLASPAVTWESSRVVAVTAGSSGSDAAGLPVAPTFAAHVPLLTQDASGVRASATLRYRTFAAEAGSSVDARLVVGREIGRLLVTTSALVGRGVGVRQDVDVEATTSATVRASSLLRLGAEARARGELAETFVTAEDEGRPVGLLGGATAMATRDDAYVQALAGWSWPRGALPPGPAAIVAAGFIF
jgi:hypothetical protein